MAVPVVRVRTMRSTVHTLKSGMRSRPGSLMPKPPPPLWKTKAMPVACIIAMAMVT
jgi:hypothetical protein